MSDLRSIPYRHEKVGRVDSRTNKEVAEVVDVILTGAENYWVRPDSQKCLRVLLSFARFPRGEDAHSWSPRSEKELCN